MAVAALINATTYVHGYDFTGDTNEIKLDAQVAVKDASVFGNSGWQVVKPGVKTATFDQSGFWQAAAAGAVDSEAFPDLGVANRVFTVAPTGIEAEVAYLLRAGKFSYEAFTTSHGELIPFKLGARGDSGEGVIRGQLAKAKGAVSATGAIGTGLNLGAVSAAQYLYGSLHIFGTPGTTITVVLESDSDNTFATATTQATFGPLTAAGGAWATRVAGSITDTWYRLRVSAITGTFSVAGAIGIGS